MCDTCLIENIDLFEECLWSVIAAVIVRSLYDIDALLRKNPEGFRSGTEIVRTILALFDTIPALISDDAFKIDDGQVSFFQLGQCF